MNNIAPCKDCGNRALHCHSTCEKYIRFKTIHDQEVEKAHLERIINHTIDDNDYHRRQRMKRKRGII